MSWICIDESNTTECLKEKIQILKSKNHTLNLENKRLQKYLRDIKENQRRKVFPVHRIQKPKDTLASLKIEVKNLRDIKYTQTSRVKELEAKINRLVCALKRRRG